MTAQKTLAEAKQRNCKSKILSNISLTELEMQVKEMTIDFKGDDSFHVSFTGHGNSKELIYMDTKEIIDKKTGDTKTVPNLENYKVFMESIAPKKAKNVTFDSMTCYPAHMRYLQKEGGSSPYMNNDDLCKYSSLPQDECLKRVQLPTTKTYCGAMSVGFEYSSTANKNTDENRFNVAAWKKINKGHIFNRSLSDGSQKGSLTHLYNIGRLSDQNNSSKWPSLSTISYIDLYYSKTKCLNDNIKCEDWDKKPESEKHSRINISEISRQLENSPALANFKIDEYKKIIENSAKKYKDPNDTIISCTKESLIENNIKELLGNIELIISEYGIEDIQDNLPMEFDYFKQKNTEAKNYLRKQENYQKLLNDYKTSVSLHIESINNAEKISNEIYNKFNSLKEKNASSIQFEQELTKYEKILDSAIYNKLNKTSAGPSLSEITLSIKSKINQKWTNETSITLKQKFAPIYTAITDIENYKDLQRFFKDENIPISKKNELLDIRKCEMKEII